tara:strand:+ start:10994 stop:11221 length:228 start_codon:yes stop_codon:yes gene_type:complete
MKRQGNGSLTQGDFTSVKTDVNGLTGYSSATLTGLIRNPSEIKSDVEIPATDNVVSAGPITISATVTVNGTWVIV